MNRTPPPPDTLNDLFVNNGNYAIIPAFNPAIREYAVNVPANVDTVDITPIQSDARATLKINQLPLTDVGESKSVTLVNGNNGIVIIVISASLTTAAYHLNIVRGDTNRSDLASLIVNGGSVAINPAFNAAVYNYTASTLTATAAVTLVTAFEQATVKLNGTAVNGDGTSTSLNLVMGANYCTIVVTDPASGNQKEYQLTISRSASNTFNYPLSYPIPYNGN